MTAVRLRLAAFPQDRALCAGFILDLQKFEYALETNRRIDDAVGEEFLDILLKRSAEGDGRIWIAEVDGEPAGWAVCFDEVDELFVEERQRLMFVVQELLVVERFRGAGVGRALLQAAEEEARRRGRNRLMIGVLARNVRAHGVYKAFGFRDMSHWLEKWL